MREIAYLKEKSFVFCFVLCSLILISNPTWSQNLNEGKIHYDFQVDYPPTFKYAPIELSNGFAFHVDNTTCMEEIFERFLEQLFQKDFRVRKKPGMTTLYSAIPPGYFETTKLIIEFNEKGRIVKTIIAGKELLEEDDHNKLKEAFQKLIFLPALRNGQPVKFIVYYTIEMKEATIDQPPSTLPFRSKN